MDLLIFINVIMAHLLSMNRPDVPKRPGLSCFPFILLSSYVFIVSLFKYPSLTRELDIDNSRLWWYCTTNGLSTDPCDYFHCSGHHQIFHGNWKLDLNLSSQKHRKSTVQGHFKLGTCCFHRKSNVYSGRMRNMVKKHPQIQIAGSNSPWIIPRWPLFRFWNHVQLAFGCFGRKNLSICPRTDLQNQKERWNVEICYLCLRRSSKCCWFRSSTYKGSVCRLLFAQQGRFILEETKVSDTNDVRMPQIQMRKIIVQYCRS